MRGWNKLLINMGAFIEQLKHAFAVTPVKSPDTSNLPDVLERVAKGVVARGLEAPAIIFLESVVPLGFLGSQAMFACWPLFKLSSIEGDYHQVAQALEDRRMVRLLASRIEELAAEQAG